MRLDRLKCRVRVRVGVAAVAVAALSGGVAALGADPALGAPAGAGTTGAPVVGTAGGPVRGLATAQVDEFLGIPYAAPPLGALRWRPPQPAAPWSGVRDATRAGSPCPQAASAFGTSSTDEDCLFLNVYTPPRAGRGAGLAVMVWIHGGSLAVGEGDGYDPTSLVGHGVVVVTINYRLGALGFLAHPALADRHGAAGNYGLMDQQAALGWVQRNIGGFGGDRRNVTIFGESAGGLSVLSHLVSPASTGLFAKAIVQSGNYAPNLASQATAEAAGEAFATRAGCADQAADCLRSLPVSAILAGQSGGVGGYQPNVDGRILTRSLQAAFDQGTFNRVPVMVGSNRDEWRLIVAIYELLGFPITAENYVGRLQSDLLLSASDAAAVAAQYPLSAYPSPSLALGAAGTALVYACTAKTADDALSRYVPTFAYEFTEEDAPELFLAPVSFPYGAAHASELPFLFSRLLGRVAPLTTAQQRLAATMQGYWAGFAKRGFPWAPGAPVWPNYTAATHVVQALATPRPHGETDLAEIHKCAFWSTIR
jgi:para-nitrobenzyl esterase